MQIIENFKLKLIEIVSAIAITIAGLSILKVCTLFFHEEELPEALKEQNPFK